MLNQCYELTKDGHVAIARLDAEAISDDLHSDVCHAFSDFCAEISEDEGIRVLLIYLNGAKTFPNSKGFLPTDFDVPPMSGSVSALDIPVIMATEGYLLDRYLELALACDLRFAGLSSIFGFPGIGNGFMPSEGGTQRLPRLVGKGKALEMILTGCLLDANDALCLGLVNRLLEKSCYDSVPLSLAREISQKSLPSVLYTKEAIVKGLEMPLDQGMRFEADLYFLLQTTHDRTEGLKAFQEKRPADFKGI